MYTIHILYTYYTHILHILYTYILYTWLCDLMLWVTVCYLGQLVTCPDLGLFSQVLLQQTLVGGLEHSLFIHILIFFQNLYINILLIFFFHILILFPYIGNSNPNWYFSEGVKPPIRICFGTICTIVTPVIHEDFAHGSRAVRNLFVTMSFLLQQKPMLHGLL